MNAAWPTDWGVGRTPTASSHVRTPMIAAGISQLVPKVTPLLLNKSCKLLKSWSLTRSARATRPSHTHTRTQVLHTHTHTGTQEHQARTRHDGRSEQQDQLVSPQRCSPVSTRPSNMCSACMDADWSVRLRARVRHAVRLQALEPTDELSYSCGCLRYCTPQRDHPLSRCHRLRIWPA